MLSIKGYKANLAVVSGRYGEMERRLLDTLADNPDTTRFRLPGGWDIQLMYLIKDGLIAVAPEGPGVFINGLPATQDYVVTDAGREFVSRWVKAEPVSDDEDVSGDSA